MGASPACRIEPAVFKVLDEGLAQFRADGFPGDNAGWESLRSALERYLSELELWNPKLGLVESTGVELVVKHVLDSLAPFGILAEFLTNQRAETRESLALPAFAMADIGSGAGLPGIPLLLAVNCLLPTQSERFTMTLVEKQQRRVGFLLNAKATLGLSNLSIAQEKLEDIAVGLLRYDMVSARAFRPLEPTVLSHLRAILKPAGKLFLYKGRIEKIAAELESCGIQWIESPFNPAIFRNKDEANKAIVMPLRVPLLEDNRHLVWI